MPSTLTISQLGEKVGLPPKTIRFYENIGLTSAPKRADNGYRIYEPQAIPQLIQIRQARDLGLPIPEIKKLMQGCQDNNCAHTKQFLAGEINSYLKTLSEKIKQLKTLEERLSTLKDNIQKDDKNMYCCNILGQLSERR